MVRWVEYAAHAARLEPLTRSARRLEPDPAPHEATCGTRGFHWGEWLEPGGDELASLDQGHVGDRVPRTTRRRSLARIGRLLGHDHEAERFDELAARARSMRGEPNTSTPTDA